MSANDGTTLKCKGLTLELLKPYLKWRITYNGLLKIHETEIKSDNGKEKLQHVIFTFL